jgi:hypothetical protein
MIIAIISNTRSIKKQLLTLSIPCSNTEFCCSRGIYSVTPNKKVQQSSGLFGEKTSDLTDQKSNFGVFKESETDDVDVLVNNYTAPALARALRERETTLHNAAHLVETGNITELAKILRPFLKTSIDKRRNESFEWDISNGLTRRELILVQRQLHRMPREVFQATSRRASVVIPLCNVSGTALRDFFFTLSSNLLTYLSSYRLGFCDAFVVILLRVVSAN